MTDDSSPDASILDTGPELGEEDPLVGTVIAERYRIDELLGVGGMGAVYRAEHVLMRKAVAVKVLHREMTFQEEVVKRFEREAIAAGRIDHPNVTVATDFGKIESGAFYLVLEYVPGKSLTDVLEEETLSLGRSLFIAKQVAAGLGAAHAAGIVHRDLKPDNVMLIERGATKDFVKVLDFGIAKVTAEGSGSPLTRLGSVFGTPAYMAPEQAAGQAVDHRADLYSLGLVLYEMVAGRAAFDSTDVVQLLAKQLTEPPPPLPDTVDPEVASLIATLVEKDPNARVQTADELVLRLEHLLAARGLAPESSVLGVPSSRAAIASSAAIATAPTYAGDLPAPTTQPRTPEAAPARSAVPVPSMLLRVLGGESVHVAGRDIPLWLFGAAVGAVFMGAVLVLALPHGGAVQVAQNKAAPPAPELGPIIRRAEAGDKDAVAELEARPEAARSAGEWMAIGKGHALFAEYPASLAAFKRAAEMDPSLTSDTVMLHLVRRAADGDTTVKPALELAAGPLGAGGADILFDVWASTNDKTDTTQLAKSLLDRDDVLAHASPSLRVALELRRATKCDDVKRLLPDAKEHADERATRRLTQLGSRHGCGFLGLADCFPCIRQNDDLSDASHAAAGRPAPKF
jgi:hypothetical protein